MAAAIVIAAIVGWYDAERRCRQAVAAPGGAPPARAEEADAWSDQFERDADSYQEAHSILAERYAALYAAHTTLIRERLAANYTVIASQRGRRRTDN